MEASYTEAVVCVVCSVAPDYGSAGQCVFQCGFGFHYAYLIFAVVQYKERIAFMYLLMFGKINLLDIA